MIDAHQKPLTTEEHVYQGAQHLDGVDSLDYAQLLSEWRRGEYHD